MLEFIHVPVLSQELITGLQIKAEGHYLDVTIGGGGHTGLILSSHRQVKVTGIDRDPLAIATIKTTLAEYLPHRLELWQGNFADYQPSTQFDGIIADLGVSSPQLDIPSRGFSFRNPAPLDMRMDNNQSLTAATIINHWEEKKLADIFYQYGEERLSRRIAKRIVSVRPINTTTELAEIIAESVPAKYRYGRIHPATRVFQALRIAVNQELESLEKFLTKVHHWLKPEGRIGIISFHSLEDRIVKHSFRNNEDLTVVTKKPITPQDIELSTNPRSRSAKLRFAEKTNL